jgi:hypothetical protein
MGETSSLRLRSKTQALGIVANSVFTVLMSVSLPYIFNPDAGNLGGKTGFVYLGLCSVGAIGTWLWLPEMKDRSPAEIDRMFALKLSSRKFESWYMVNDERAAPCTHLAR